MVISGDYVCCSVEFGSQCRTGIKGPGRELFDGGPCLNNIELHILQIGIGKYTTHIIIYKI